MKNQEYINKIKLKAENAKISPSENAWEKLEFMLAEEKKSKKTFPVFWIGIAASICFLISVFYFQNINQSVLNQNVTKINSIKIKKNSTRDKNQIENLITQKNIQVKSKKNNENFINKEHQNEEKIISKVVVDKIKNKQIKIDVPKVENQNTIANQSQENFVQKEEITNETQKIEENHSEQITENNKIKKRKSYVQQDVLLFSVENELHPIPENHSKKQIEFAKTIIHHLSIK